MERNLIALLIVIAGYGVCFAQTGGNVGYSQSGGKARAEQNERNKRTLTKEEAPLTPYLKVKYEIEQIKNK